MAKIVKNWSYNEGKALIAVYEQRREEFNKARNKKHFWESVLTDLEAMGVLESTTTSEQVQWKWATLYRAYKSAKDRGTGTSSTKFLFMEEMDSIFHDNPLLNSPHSVMVGTCEKPQPITSTSISLSEEIVEVPSEPTPTPPQQKKLPKKAIKPSSKSHPKKKSLLEIKQEYYQEKIEEKRKKRTFMEKYLVEKEANRDKRHREQMEVYKKRNNIYDED